MELQGWTTRVMLLNQRAKVEPEDMQSDVEPMGMRMMVELEGRRTQVEPEALEAADIAICLE
ncbi:hypothetical protein M9458_051439, partial [Cirrhinus mrigala]